MGYALVIDGRVHCPASGPGTIAGLPARSELLGGTGQLESTVSDEAVLAAARRLRILPAASATRANGSAGAVTDLLRAARAGNQQAGDLLAERARVLGESVALLRDLLNPDELVVGGQAFTEYPEGMEQVEKAFAACSVLPPRDIRVTAFGNRVQEAGPASSRWAGSTPIRWARCVVPEHWTPGCRIPSRGRSLSAAYARAWA
ncbi:putative transcriptional regulatory protein [Mycobacterium kansasii]|uniref:Putative transcriptional regulatory protein n=1 Tax=Mycobacterium kansasii TaxID=1768 RepID=A0A1V3WP36_MYCKA|nr:putative transcriptional regulatory protein [Mycobacterium kansasii]